MDINTLITCPKRIERKKRPQFRKEYRHYRMSIKLTCSESNYKMSMFLRRLVDFPEDFSVGLRLEGPNDIKEQDIVLVRYQGPHGGQSAEKSSTDLHNTYHIHEYTQNDIDCRRKNASYKEEGSFSSFEEAVIMFMKRCNIDDPNGIFDEEMNRVSQIRMDFDLLKTEREMDHDHQ